MEAAAVDEARDQLARIDLLARVAGDDAVEFVGIVGGRLRRRAGDPRRGRTWHGGEDLARDPQRVGIVGGQVIGDAGDAGVGVAAAELLGRHLLAGRRLHERRASQEDRALVLHDDGLVAHGRDVGAARRAGAQHDGHLRQARRRHARLVVEDAAEVIAVGEDLGLQRQERSARIDEVDAGQAVLERDLLRAQVLLHGERVVGAALHRGVVGDHDGVAAGDLPDAGDDPRARGLVVVAAPGRQRADLEERRARVEQVLDALARQELAARSMALAGLGRTAGGDLRPRGAQLGHQARSCARGSRGTPDRSSGRGREDACRSGVYQKIEPRAERPSANIAAMRAFTWSTFSPSTSSSSLGLPAKCIGSPK